MKTDENERLGLEALDLFMQILLDYVATAGEDDVVDTRVVIEEYLSAHVAGHPTEGIATRLRALAEAVRDTVLSRRSGG